MVKLIFNYFIIDSGGINIENLEKEEIWCIIWWFVCNFKLYVLMLSFVMIYLYGEFFVVKDSVYVK